MAPQEPSPLPQTPPVSRPSFTPAITRSPRQGSNWSLVAIVIIALVVILIAYFLFSKPEALPSTALFEKLFPSGSGIRELETINIDLQGILSHPVLRTLQEHGPLPLQIPPLGKPNPFI